MKRREEDKENEMPEMDETESEELQYDEQEIMDIYEDSSRRMQFVTEQSGRKQSNCTVLTSAESTPALQLTSTPIGSVPIQVAPLMVTNAAPVVQAPTIVMTPTVTAQEVVAAEQVSSTNATPRMSITVSNWKTPRKDIVLPPTPVFDMGGETDEEFPKVSVKELINTFENVQHKEKVHVKTIDRLIKESSSESEVSTEGKQTFPSSFVCCQEFLLSSVESRIKFFPTNFYP